MNPQDIDHSECSSAVLIAILPISKGKVSLGTTSCRTRHCLFDIILSPKFRLPQKSMMDQYL